MARLTTNPDGTSIGAEIARAMHATYERQRLTEEWRRAHLGASVIGHECDRYVWMSYRWAARPSFDGRMLRLFNRGNREEGIVATDLRKAGFEVDILHPVTGRQFFYSLDGTPISCSLDGKVRGGVLGPEWLTLEIKTHNAKQFAKLKRDGLKKAKPQHWAQCQIGMHLSKLGKCLYVAVCKDDDQIWCDVVSYDAVGAGRLVRDAINIAARHTPPDRLDREQPPCVYTTSEGERFECQFFNLCHGKQIAEKNCRTCLHADHDGPEWHCMRRDLHLTTDGQRAGCGLHLTIPDIINAQVASTRDDPPSITYQFADGTVHVDGNG